MTDPKGTTGATGATGSTGASGDRDKVREEAHKKNLEYDPTEPKKTKADERLEKLNKRREEEYKQDAAEAKDRGVPEKRPSTSPQSQGPGGGMAAGEGYRVGPSQEEIESPVQAMRDPRQDTETTNVDSGGDLLDRRGGKPASKEERKAWGDKIPEGDDPFGGGVPGSHRPGEPGPSKEQKEKDAKELARMRGEEVDEKVDKDANVKDANKKAETATPPKR